MAVGDSVRAAIFPFLVSSGDPALPNAWWSADVEATGDASGGENTLDVIFSEAGSADDQLWSVEQFADQHDIITSLDRLFIPSNQRNLLNPGTPITSTVKGVSGGGILARTGWEGRDLMFLPYFMGGPPGARTGLRLFARWVVLNTNFVAYRVHAWGYRWGSQAYAAPGGPRRPIGSVFGS